jgi:predicted Zn-dependent protease
VSELLALAERVLALVGDAAEAEVAVSAGPDGLTRFANSFIHQNMASDERRVVLRLNADGRTASATTTRTDAAALGRLVEQALDAARVRPVDEGWPGVAPPATAPDVDHWDPATAAAEPGVRADRVGAFIAAGDGLEAAGFCRTTATQAAYANTAGQRLTGRATSATLDGIFRTGTADGSARRSSPAVSDLDGRALGERAAKKAREGAEPTDLPPGRYEVVFEPGCVANIVSFLALYGFNGRAVEEGRSFVALGERQFDPAVSLRDDVTDPISMGLPFDVEGTPKRRVDLVDAGTTVGVCHNRRTAKSLGAESTGHASPAGETWGALPANLILAPGERSTADLIAGVKRGLLVTDFWYTRILDPRTQVVTGLTRNGVWLIEDGSIRRAVGNLRFTQSYLDALAPGGVQAVGDELAVNAGALGVGAYAVPSLHLMSWNFTGGARG